MQLPQLIPALPHISTSFFINTPVLIGIMAVFLVLYLIISSVLVYHWHAYGMQSHGILVGETLFIFISAVLFVIAGLSINYF